jgi:selenocysteine lyase/cysteine desulfurase
MNWTTLRDEFSVTHLWTFLDHAAVAAPPERACNVLAEWAYDMGRHGVTRSGHWWQRVDEARAVMGRLLNADPLDVAFVKNTSEGVGFVAEGFPWQPGDNVVTAAEEYPANVYPWMNLQSRGVEVRLVPSRGPRIEIDDLRQTIDARTRVVSLSHVEFAGGFRNDLAAVGQLCRERDIFFFVDAIQGLGVLPLDVQKVPVDALAADGHKWLLGPEGAGVFYVRREWVERLRAVGVGWHSVAHPWDFSALDFTLQPHAGRWESGSLNLGGIVALAESVQLLLDLGLDQVRARVLELTDHLCERAASLGLEVFSSRRAEDRSGIVSLLLPGADPREAVKRCRAEGIIVTVRGGRLRVSPHCYNTPGEIDRLLDVLRGTV